MTRLGKKHVELAVKWIPSAMTYGAAGTCALLYFTDWKLILQYMPYYSGKWKTN